MNYPVLPIFFVPVLYLVVLAVAVILTWQSLKSWWRGLPGTEAKEKSAAIPPALAALRDRIFIADPAQLAAEKVIGLSRLNLVINILSHLYYLPVIVLRHYLGLRYGARLAYRIPCNGFELWDWVVITICYYYSMIGYAWLALVLGTLIIIFNLQDAFSIFQRTATGWWLPTQPNHRISLLKFLAQAVTLIAAFGAIYHSIAHTDSDAFNAPLGVIDSLYFSTISAATVGYGDIYPKSDAARLIVMAEIAVGWTFSLLIVASVIAVKITLTLESSKPKTPSAPPTVPVLEVGTQKIVANAIVNGFEVDKESAEAIRKLQQSSNSSNSEPSAHSVPPL